MSKKLITILLLVINVISLKSEINEAIQTNSFVNVTGKGSDVEKIIKWRFPEANFDSCCSTIETKQYYLKTCNTIFNQENIECVDVLKGSVILYLKSTRIDFEKGVLSALSGIKDIGGNSTENHHKYSCSEDELNAILTKCDCSGNTCATGKFCYDGMCNDEAKHVELHWDITSIFLIVIFTIAGIALIVVIIFCFWCCEKQNSIQPYPSPKQNLYTANLHPIQQNPAAVYQNQVKNFSEGVHV